MNGRDLLTGMGEISPKFYEEAEKGTIKTMNNQKRTRTFRGTAGKVLLAAAIISALTVTAFAAGQGWFQRYFESRSEAPLTQTEADFLAEHEQPIYESQTQDGYTMTVKSAISDGRMAYINIGIRGPEGKVLSKTQIPGYDPAAPSLTPSNFETGFFEPANGELSQGKMTLTTLEDYDGLDHTQDWLLLVEREGQLPFAPGNSWKLHIEDLIATYQDNEVHKELSENSGSEPGTLMPVSQEDAEKLLPKETLATGAWDFTINFKACDTRTIELIGDPVTAACLVELQDDVSDPRTVKITSISLSTFGAVISADAEFMPAFSSAAGGQYVQVVMKDGSQVRLLPGSATVGQQKLEAERPVILDQVDYVLLMDGTQIPMP